MMWQRFAFSRRNGDRQTGSMSFAQSHRGNFGITAGMGRILR